jgi:transposase
MSFLGLTTTEYSSGDNRRQGAISKAGNSHARRFLVESAQHYKNTPKVSQSLSSRQVGISKEITDIAWNAQVRLHKRYWALVNKGKNYNTATVAIARELIGFIWNIYRKSAPII